MAQEANAWGNSHGYADVRRRWVIVGSLRLKVAPKMPQSRVNALKEAKNCQRSAESKDKGAKLCKMRNNGSNP